MDLEQFLMENTILSCFQLLNDFKSTFLDVLLFKGAYHQCVTTLPVVPAHRVEGDSADAGSGGCPLPASFGQEACFPPLLVPQFPQCGSWHTCAVAGLRGAASATPCVRRWWHWQPQASLGTRFWGPAPRGARGVGEDSARPGAGVSWGCGSVTPRREGDG